MDSVLFDFGGTLDCDGVTWLDRFYPLYKEAGIAITREGFARAFYVSDNNLARRFPLKGLSLEETLSLQVQCVLEVLAPAQMALKAQIVRLFLSESRRHFQRNKPFLGRLGRRYRLGIVSNFYGNLEGALDSEGLRGLFSVVADSGVVGIQKPDAGIFLHALEGLGAEPSGCVMVGDSIPRDMRGAELLGIKHALLTQGPETRCCPGAWTLRALTDLEPLIT